jgi:VanZ family protein
MINWLKQDNPVFAWIPLFIWASVLLLFSILPCDGQFQLTVGCFDKIAHFFGYAVLAVLIVRTIHRVWGLSPARNHLFTLISGSGYGIVMELMQRFIPGREASTGDVISDIAGVIVGIVLGKMMLWRK